MTANRQLDMQAEEFIVPYPLEDCVRRIEGLHENEVRPRPILVDSAEQLLRTAVALNTEQLSPVTYSVGRVRAWKPYKSKHTLVKTYIQFEPNGDETTVYLSFSLRPSAAIMRSNGMILVYGALGLSSIGVMGYLSSSTNILTSSLVTVTFVVGGGCTLGGLLFYALGLKTRHLTYLLAQIYQAFGVAYDPETMQPIAGEGQGG